MQNMTLRKLRIAQKLRQMERNGFLIGNKSPRFSRVNPFLVLSFIENIHFKMCKIPFFATLVANCMKTEADREKRTSYSESVPSN